MEVISAITNFIFIENEPEKSDIILIPGCSRPELMEVASDLWHKGYAPLLLPSGKYSVKTGAFPGTKTKKDKYPGPYETECDFMIDIAIKCGVSPKSLLREDASTYTKENAFFSKKVIDAHGLKVNKALICCKSFHARRALMYYKWAFPETDFKIIPVDTDDVNKDNWYKTEYGIERVMGELMRCGAQLKEAIPAYYNTFWNTDEGLIRFIPQTTQITGGAWED